MERKLSVQRDIEDRDYFTRRALEERQRAGICEDGAVALAHLKMAEEYERRANSISPRNVPVNERQRPQISN